MKTRSLTLFTIAILMSFATSAFSQEASWTTNYAKALEQAKIQNKVILLDFTGSDWCGWCMKMKQESLDTPVFKHYAKKNLMLVEVDFPHEKPQTEVVKKQNQQLAGEFKVSSYPTFVLLDKDGKELGRQGGYLAGGPSAFITKLNTFYTPAPANSATGSSTGAGSNFDALFKKPAQSPTP